MFCKYCEKKLSSKIKRHKCNKKGLLDVDDDDSFLVSVLVAEATDSALLGSAIGGDFLGGIVGDLLDGDLLD